MNLTPKQREIVKALSKSFNESDHPRADDGKFSNGGESSGGTYKETGNKVNRLSTTGEDVEPVNMDDYHKKIRERLGFDPHEKRPLHEHLDMLSQILTGGAGSEARDKAKEFSSKPSSKENEGLTKITITGRGEPQYEKNIADWKRDRERSGLSTEPTKPERLPGR
jgi:hypothetical protein